MKQERRRDELIDGEGLPEEKEGSDGKQEKRGVEW